MGYTEAAAYEVASKRLRKTPETVRRYYASLRPNKLRGVIREAWLKGNAPAGIRTPV